MSEINQRIADLEQELRRAKDQRRRATRGPRDEPGGLLYFTIGGLIRETRIAIGMNQADLAQRIGITRTSIVNIEVGRQRLPIALLYDIADALGVQAVQLLPRNEEV